MEKSEIREKMSKVREEISPDEKKKDDSVIFEKLKKVPWFKDSDVVLSYSSFGSEIDTSPINDLAINDKELFLPKIDTDDKTMTMYQTESLDNLKSGYAGIMEPDGGLDFADYMEKAKDEGKKVCMIVPGLAYDEMGGRVGYGGGYYDKFVNKYKDMINRIILLAYDEQSVEEVPMESYDLKADMVITQKRMII